MFSLSKHNLHLLIDVFFSHHALRFITIRVYLLSFPSKLSLNYVILICIDVLRIVFDLVLVLVDD